MREKYNNYKNNIRLFCNTQYYSEFIKNIAFMAFLWIFFLVSAVLMIKAPAKSARQHTMIILWVLIGLLVFAVFTVSYWIRYYHTVITAALKIENIKKKYSLIDADKMTTYVSSLNIILDLIDSSLEKEYSNRLLQKQAELDAMQSQINPHFLYNTLDTIRGYAVMEDAPLTSDMVEVLSRLFRYMISQKNELVTLRQELSTLHDYIKIQEYRINQHIVFMQNIAPDLQIMNYRIPKLIIQPFIENAIKHGIKGLTKDFVITLNIYNTQSRLIISISDNGGGMAPEQLRTLNQKLAKNESDSVYTVKDKKTGSGIALTNVNSRIKLLYGDSFGVVAYSTLGKGSEFQISLPYFQNQE